MSESRRPWFLDTDVILTVLLWSAAVVGLVTAAQWRPGARLLPQVVCVVVISLVLIRMCGWLLVLVRGGEISREPPSVAGIAPAEFRVRQRQEVAWVSTFIVAGFFVGVQYAIPTYLMAYFTFRARIRLVWAILLTCMAMLFFFGLFSRVLNLRIPGGWLMTLG